MANRLIVLCLIVLCAGLGACGDHDGNSSSGFPNKIDPDVGKNGVKTLRRGNGAEPQSLDPHRASGVPAANILRDLYEGLVAHAPDGSIVPADARSWKISDDHKTYTFKLRGDARWSNGKPVTAQDYVYSLRRAVDPATASPYAGLHSPIVNASAIVAGDKPPKTLAVKALDAHTLRIRLQSPTPYFLGTLAHPASFPVYKPAIKQYGDAFTKPGHAVTNGAYEMASWRVNDKIVLKRNPHYWDNANTRIDRVVYYPITDGQAELSRYQAGGLDWTAGAPISKLDALHQHVPRQIHTVDTLGVAYVGLNVTRAPFKDSPKLRKALSMAIDRKIIVHKILRGGQKPAYGWIPPAIGDYKGRRFEWVGLSDEARKKKAKALYKAAGYSKTQPLHVQLLYPTSNQGKRFVSVIAAMWRSVLGADVDLRNQEWKVYLQTTRNQKDTEAFTAGWIGDYNDPNTFFHILNSHSKLNYTGYHSARYNRLENAQANTPNGHKRTQLMHEAESQLLHDIPVIPIYFYTIHHVVKPYVTGFTPNALDIYDTKNLDIQP